MLTLDGCRARQERFLAALAESGLDGALLSHPRDIYYFSGLWVENKVFEHPSLLFLGPGRRSWLGTWVQAGEAAADERDTYPASLLSTMNPDNHLRLARLAESAAGKFARGVSRLGFQAEGGPKFVLDVFLSAIGPGRLVPIDALLIRQQLKKDPDEVACIRRAMDAALAGYGKACQILAPGANELEVLAECSEAALGKTGRPHYYGGDFRCGERNGPARDRAIPAGEIYIIDAQADVDGYWSDLSRAWIAGGEPTDLQQSVYDHLARILSDVPRMVRPGKGCRELWKELDARIREHPRLADTGLVHHGGHGIGLRAHEGPDINRDRDGTFEVGNTFAVEPGAYLPELRAGIRLEDNFLLHETAVETLSPYPFEFLPVCR